jgi:hypothetical protein
MDTKELITAVEAAEMLSMTVNAFRIFVHRYGSGIKKVRLGRRRILYLRVSVLAVLKNA